MLDAGADPNCIDTSFLDNRTALHKAASNGFKDILDLLIAYGGDPNLRDAKKHTAFELYDLYLSKHNTVNIESSDIIESDESSNVKNLQDIVDGSLTSIEQENSTYTESHSDEAGISASKSTDKASITMGISCPMCGNPSLLFTRYLRGGLVCLNCYSKR